MNQSLCTKWKWLSLEFLALALLAMGAAPSLGQVADARRIGIPQETPPAPNEVTKERVALLPKESRDAIARKLEEVRKEIERNEDEMFGLTYKHEHYHSLVTSRDRWHAELDRVQTEIRLADKDLAEAKARNEQMQSRIGELRQLAAKQLQEDEALKILNNKLGELRQRWANVKGDTTIKEKARPGMLNSAMGEILDTEMEIAQRIESLTISYTGGQAQQMERELRELESNVKVKESAKMVLSERFKILQGLSEDITRFARIGRKVYELEILHRKLAELNAQQEVEFLKSDDPNKQPRIREIAAKK
jgi:hypothetical protein